MNNPKILDALAPNSVAFSLVQLIASDIDAKRDIEEKIKKNVIELSNKLRDFFKEDESLKKIHRYFNITASFKKEGSASTKDTLINIICLQIALSIERRRNQAKENTDCDEINIEITALEILKHLNIRADESPKEVYSDFNEKMSKYGISLASKNLARDEDSILRVILKIF